MLTGVQSAINRRTGWADWFIGVFLLYVAVIAILATVLLATNPSGFLTVALWGIGSAAIAVFIAFLVTAERYGEWLRQGNKNQQQLIKVRFHFVQEFRLIALNLTQGLAVAGILCGFIAAFLP